MIIPELADTLFYYEVEIPLVVTEEGEAPPWLDKRLRTGMKLKLPYVQAMELLSTNLVQIDYGSIISLRELKKLCWNEERSEALQPLEEGFYLKLGLYMSYLKREVAQGKTERESELRSMRVALTDLLSLRLKKIVNLAVTSRHVEHEKMRHMTPEEKVLYVQLCNILNFWSDSLQRISGGV